MEDSNAFNPYAVAIRKSENVIGHVPWKSAGSLFIQRGGTLTCILIDSRRQYSADLPQGGLQIATLHGCDPAVYVTTGILYVF